MSIKWFNNTAMLLLLSYGGMIAKCKKLLLYQSFLDFITIYKESVNSYCSYCSWLLVLTAILKFTHVCLLTVTFVSCTIQHKSPQWLVKKKVKVAAFSWPITTIRKQTMRHSSVKFGRALKSTINNERIQKNVVTHGPFHFFHLGRKNSDAGVYHHPSIHHGAESKHFYLPSVIDNPFRVRGKPTRGSSSCITSKEKFAPPELSLKRFLSPCLFCMLILGKTNESGSSTGSY